LTPTLLNLSKFFPTKTKNETLGERKNPIIITSTSAGIVPVFERIKKSSPKPKQTNP
jgi:hypothetical protein